MILWCLNSWNQRDSCEQDDDIHQISDQGDTRSHLKGRNIHQNAFMMDITVKND